MKKNLLLFVAALFSYAIVNAQDDKPIETLLGKPNVTSVSGFGGYLMEFSKVEGSFAMCNGGGGALLINQKFYFGGYGLGLSTDHYLDTSKLINKDKDLISFGHGGFWLGYQNNAHKLVHFNVSSKFGWGQISLYDDVFDMDNLAHVANDNIYVITPQIEAEINMATWFRINAGLGYRLVTGIDRTQYYKESNYSSPLASLSFVFGGFGKKNRD